MNRIKFLPEDIANKIAAGEVIINGSAVIKELIENAIDAGSKTIKIETKNGGKSLIRITDDGTGLEKEDIPIAFLRGTTSKIHESIEAIATLGFRGEALASISQVSKIALTTKTEQNDVGILTKIKDNRVIEEIEVVSKTGTIIEVSDLFYNMPARYKFLNDEKKETVTVIETVSQLAISHPEIAFMLICDDKEIFRTDGEGDLRKTMRSVIGRSAIDGLIDISFHEEPLSVKGVISSAQFVRKHTSFQYLILNGRFVKIDALRSGIIDVYQELFGFKNANYILDIKLPYHMIDVNIHPSKLTVKLHNESLIVMLIKQGIKDVLKQKFIIKNDGYGITEKKEVLELVQEQKQKYPFKQIGKNTEKVIDPIDQIETKSEEALSVSEQKQDNMIETQLGFIENNENNTIEEKIDRSIFQHLQQLRYIGNAFGLYALIESNEYLYSIDTHAAHERILYDKYLAAFHNKSVDMQTLMLPIVFHLVKSEHFIVMQNTELLMNIGFEIDDLGDDAIALRSFPYYLQQDDMKHIIPTLIQKLKETTNTNDFESRNETLIKSACHNAVRGKEYLCEQEVMSLLDELSKTDMPFTCPHGRPVLGKVNMKYFMKVFERI